MVGIDLTGKNVLITGGASGIGKASAKSFAASGARVAVTDIDRDGIQETVRGLGNEHFAIDGDISKKNDVDTIIKAAGKALGNIDILINSAGVSDVIMSTVDQEFETWQRIIDINLTGTFLASQAVAPDMLKRGNGCIVNVSSIAGLVGLPRRNAYTASKHGVAGITKTLAAEWGISGVRVNAVAPGYVLTPMVADLISSGKLDEKNLMRRTPLGRSGGLGSSGTTCLLVATPIRSSRCSAARPSIPKLRTQSITSMWVSVPPVTRWTPRSSRARASARALRSTRAA